jgi:hypothetical protein
MSRKLDKIIKLVYDNWKGRRSRGSAHPDEETLSLFLDGTLTGQESAVIRGHILSCSECAEKVGIQLRLSEEEGQALPLKVLTRAKGIVRSGKKDVPLEIALLFKEKLIDLIHVTGDVVFGQEVVPAPLLRNRKVSELRDEVTVLKDFKDFSVQVKVENKNASAFSLFVVVKEKESGKILRDLRITLFKGDIELESYIADSGKVVFDNVALGSYTVEISGVGSKLASILLDIKSNA